MQFVLHGCIVTLPLATTLYRTIVESIGVWVDVDAEELAINHACYHLLQLGILIGKLNVRPHLRPRVSQPHGMNVTRIDKGIWPSLCIVAEVHRRVNGIWEAVGKHPRQLLVL